MRLITGLIAAVILCAPASAATIISNAYGDYIEGGVAPAANAPDLRGTDRKLGDFGPQLGDPLFQVTGDLRIFGGVAHRKKNRYYDNWSMDFGTDVYAGVFNWAKTSAAFDGRLIVGKKSDVEAILAGDRAVLDGATGASLVILERLGHEGSIRLSGLTGALAFVVDPIFGRNPNNPDEVATWDISLSQVPLPAGVWMTLSALAGLIILRRRRTV